MVDRPVRPNLLRWGICVLVLVLVASAMPSAQAQPSSRVFPETGHTLGGGFLAFWESNGGLPIFGYPITEEFVSDSTGRTTQYFERARFELNEQNGQTVVELGKLGVEFTQGRIFPKVPSIENNADKRYFPETQHIVQYGFKQIWETRGGQRIFGLPISEEIDEVLEDGEWHTVQYFENIRFEYWPAFPDGERVLISRLGLALAPPELLPPPGQAPQPAPPQPAPPQPEPQPAPPAQEPLPPPEVPQSVNATVTPEFGQPGTTFQFTARGFEPGENVGIWLTAPDQSTFGAGFQAEADNQGTIDGEEIALTTDQGFPDGVWSFNAQGVKSGRQAIGYFLVSRTAGLTPGDPNKLGEVVHDQLYTQGDVFILPVAAPSGTPFLFLGGGYTPDETVSGWVTGPDGSTTPIDEAFVDNDSGGVVQMLIETGGLPDGVYTAVAQGVSSGVATVASFKLTRDFVAGPGTPRPANMNGVVTPPEGGTGTTFELRGQGLAANEDLEFWITDPTGAYTLFPGLAFADEQGRVGYDPPLDLEVTNEAVPGVYGLHFRGFTSGVRVDLYFTVAGTGGRSVGAPGIGSQFINQLVAKGSLPSPFIWVR